MPSSNASDLTIGFLTIVSDPQCGHIGGYLLLNAQARPLEFHCTAPVVPTRAQEVLYGVTLRGYLYGDLMASALVAGSRRQPDALISDCPEVVAAVPLGNVPTLWLLDERAAPSDAWQRLVLGPHEVAVPTQTLLAPIRSLWDEKMREIALEEPFERIREAIDEAQRPGRAA